MNPELNRHLSTLLPTLITDFHEKRIEKLREIKLRNLLKRKNPYLYKAKNINTGHELIKALLDAYLSSQEETLFGTVLESIAIQVCAFVHRGYKSGIEGIDLEFDHEVARYIVSVKSGPNWGNSSQINKMIDHFNKARRILRTSNGNIQVIAINGCCYGQSTADNIFQEKGDYQKLCGQKFWELLSRDSNFYLDLIEPIGRDARIRNDAFMKEYRKLLTFL